MLEIVEDLPKGFRYQYFLQPESYQQIGFF